MEVVYLDANLPDSDGTYGELAADPNKKKQSRIRSFCGGIKKYFWDIFAEVLSGNDECKSRAAESSGFILCTYFAACSLYHVWDRDDSRFQGASAAWAFEHMQEKTMEILGEQSEEEMQEWLYDSLRWSENFWNQMDLEIYVNSERKLLKDVVYTEVYDQRRIDDWSESMHKTVTELAHREIKKDKRLANWAVDHIVESDKTYNLFKGGRKK